MRMSLKGCMVKGEWWRVFGVSRGVKSGSDGAWRLLGCPCHERAAALFEARRSVRLPGPESMGRGTAASRSSRSSRCAHRSLSAAPRHSLSNDISLTNLSALPCDTP